MSEDPSRPCPLTAALKIIGGKWHLIVLYALAQRPRRFNELQRLAPGISHKVLTRTVRHLEAEGLVDREVGAVAGPGMAPCVRYSLSERGESVRPILTVISQWGDLQLATIGSSNNAHR